MSRTVHRTAGIAVLASMLAACVSTPSEPFSDKLDPDTATTVTVMTEPVELVSDALHIAGGDPFVYLAPFETNQMGQRALYLWISAPQNNGPLTGTKVQCDEGALELQPMSTDLAEFQLSRAPYSPPTSWGVQWYFRLTREALDCLSSAQAIHIETQSSQGTAQHFTATGKALIPLQAFARH